MVLLLSLCSGAANVSSAAASSNVRGFDGKTVIVAGMGTTTVAGEDVGARARFKVFNDTNEMPGVRIRYVGFNNDNNDPATALGIARKK